MLKKIYAHVDWTSKNGFKVISLAQMSCFIAKYLRQQSLIFEASIFLWGVKSVQNQMNFSVIWDLFLLSVFPSVFRVYTGSLPGILFPHLTQDSTWHRHNASVTLIVTLAPTSDPALIVTFKPFSTRALSGPMSVPMLHHGAWSTSKHRRRRGLCSLHGHSRNLAQPIWEKPWIWFRSWLSNARLGRWSWVNEMSSRNTNEMQSRWHDLIKATEYFFTSREIWPKEPLL